jgi:hypothetical protein
MKHSILFLALCFLVSAAIDVPRGQAQPTIAQASNNCPPRKTGTPLKERYINLKAVGLLITDYSQLQRLVDCHDREEECSEQDFSKSKIDLTLPASVEWVKEKTDYYKTAFQFYSPSVQFTSVLNEFTKQIGLEIVPWLVQDANCKVADVRVFKIGLKADEVAVNDFMKTPGRLLIVFDVHFVGLPYPDDLTWHSSPQEHFHDVMTKFGPPLLLMSIHYYRSDGLPLNLENAVLDAKQIVIPLNTPPVQLAERIKWFIGNIGVSSTGSAGH